MSLFDTQLWRPIFLASSNPDAAQDAAAETTSGLSYLLGFDAQLLQEMVLTAISVLVLFVVLSYLLFNPVRKFLQDRKDKIASDLSTAEAGRREADTLRAEYEEKLKHADREVDVILNNAHKTGLENEARIVSKAKEEAARIIARAKEEACLEQNRMQDEVKREMIVIATLLASKIVASSMDMKAQDDLVEQTLKEIGESTWPR